MDVYHGECFDFLPLIPDRSVDLILADLPYKVTKNSWDCLLDMQRLWKEYERISNGPIVLFGSGRFTGVLMQHPWWKYNLIWKKTTVTGHLNAKKMPLRQHEDICVFYKKSVYNPQKTFGHERKVSSSEHKRNSKATTNWGKHGLTSYDSTERYPTSVLEFKTDKQKSRIHPTQKPVELLRYMIRTYSNVGDLVLDNTAGSLSTGEACEAEGRECILMEKESIYLYPGLERLRSYKLIT